jgi:hypothetical protein
MFYVATVDTRNFTFTAYGETKLAAMTALEKVFELHIKRTGAYITWCELLEDVFVKRVAFGKGYVN